MFLLREDSSYGPPGKWHYRYRTTEWAKRPDVNKAYRELAEQHDLVDKELRDTDRVFGLLVSQRILENLEFESNQIADTGTGCHDQSYSHSELQVSTTFKEVSSVCID